MINVLVGLACSAFGLFAGYHYRELTEIVRTLQRRFDTPKPAVGPTPGSYHPANENRVNQDATKTGPVVPKTPALLEWEEQQRIKQLNEQVHVVQR